MTLHWLRVFIFPIDDTWVDALILKGFPFVSVKAVLKHCLVADDLKREINYIFSLIWSWMWQSIYNLVLVHTCVNFVWKCKGLCFMSTLTKILRVYCLLRPPGKHQKCIKSCLWRSKCGIILQRSKEKPVSKIILWAFLHTAVCGQIWTAQLYVLYDQS